jgi:hypothetical protein
MKFVSPLVMVAFVFSAFAAGEEAKASAPVPAVGDKYMYPFIDDSPIGGRRPYASVFGAYGSIDDSMFDFDDRDAQFFLDFATAAVVPAGKGVSNYRVLSLTVSIVVENENFFGYDPTFDLLATYTGASADSDASRPMELYGVGYRAGWTRSTFDEDAPFQTEPSSAGQPNWNRKRNAFAMDFDLNGVPRDVSNNVQELFEVSPWAVADSPGYIDYEGNFVESPLAAGSLVPEGRVFRFQVDLTNPHVVGYLQDSLNAGRLHLMVSSLYGTARQSADIPRFYTRDFNDPLSEDYDPLIDYYLGPQLEAEVLLLPSTGVSRHGGTYRVSFDTVTGQNYQVEYRDSLTAGHWLPLGPSRSGTGATINHDDAPPAGVTSRFYRIAVSKHTQS